MEAIQDYNRVLAMDKTNAHALHNRGISFDKINKYDSAVSQQCEPELSGVR